MTNDNGDEVPLEEQEIVDIDEQKIVKEQFDKIRLNPMFQDFVPNSEFFAFNNKILHKKCRWKKVKKVQRKSKGVTYALNDELVDQFKKDSDDEFEERKQIHREQLSLNFIIEEREEDTAEMIEDKIHSEVTKTKEQKMEDFLSKPGNLPMKNGGDNDVLQAVL